MKQIITIIIFFLASLQSVWAVGNAKLMIFRNDSIFNVIALKDDFSIKHFSREGCRYIEVNDETVPLAAVDSCVVRDKDIPTLLFTLPEYPDAETVWSKENYVDAVLSVEGNGMAKDVEGMNVSIKGRGNSTWWLPKKPIRLKFAKKTSLCGFTKAKSYVLLANYLDRSLMCNAISLWLANRLGIPYSNHTMPCNVVFNDRYIGSYLLTEKIGLNAGSIDDIDENKGVLFEMSTEFDEKYKFKTERFALPVMVKDPDFDELYINDPSITPEQRLAMWESDFNRAVSIADFNEFDLESFLNYQIVISFAKNSEVGYPKSVYLHKSALDCGAKYVFGPAWDFDIGYNFRTPLEEGYKEALPTADTWQNQLFRTLKNRPEFKEAYQTRFEEFVDTILPELLEFADNYARIIEPSARLDGQRWPEIYQGSWYYRFSSFDNQHIYEDLRSWILQRVEAMRSKLPEVL